ncbi:MAG TPA: hypothetical protein V6D14_16870 [Coleofasciculaceae cyanobacterium]|jgi:uncharacterized membrane protein
MNAGVFVGALSSASVEFFETAAIAYAIARSGYKQEAYWGTLAGLVIVGVATAILGTGLQLIPLRLLQVVIGAVLLWFGWGWVKKSVYDRLGVNALDGSATPSRLKAFRWNPVQQDSVASTSSS